MKKVLSLVLIFLMLSSAVSAVYAANDSSDRLNELLTELKERIGSTDMYDEFTSSVQTYNGENEYSFSWRCTEDDKDDSLDISMNESGIVTSYYEYKSEYYDYERKPSINRPSSQEALKTAEAAFKSLNPDIADSIKITEYSASQSLRGGTFGFKLQRYENGYPVIGDWGAIYISPDSSKITSMHLNYTQGLKFEDASALISREEAINSFNQSFGMELCYSAQYQDREKTAVLEYIPRVEYNQYISAVNAGVVEQKQNDDAFFRDSAGDMGAAENSKSLYSGGGGGLTKTELKELEKIEGLMSSDEAEKLLRANDLLPLTDDYTLTRQYLSRDYYDQNLYTLSMSFSHEDENKYSRFNATINAATGEILSFNKSGGKSGENKLSRPQAAETAEKAVKKLAQSHFGSNPDFIADETQSDDTSGTFYYTRYVNGIRYSGNRIFINIDLTDGTITSYSMDFDNIAFPSADGTLTPDEACGKLFEQIDYSVYYLPAEANKSGCEALLVYASDDDNMILDAFSGELKYRNETSEIGSYTDIDGHYAQEAINELARFGIGFEGESFLPDSQITQAEFTTLLNAAFVDIQPIVIGKAVDYTYVYNRAENAGIIKEDEYSPDAPLTRDRAAVMMIRALGLEEAASLSGIFVPLFSDVTENIGYTSILSAMGVISGDESGKFNPDMTLTRADAAIMLYKCLSK